MVEGNGNAATLTREFVPQELHDRPYLKDFLDKPWEKGTAAEIFKKLDGAESLLGKRPQVPDFKTGKEEDILKFFEQGRPEKADDYEIKLDEGVAKPNDAFLKAVRTAFHEGRINKAQANKFLATMDNFGREERKRVAVEQQKKDAEFDTLAKTVLGEQNKAVMENTRKLIKDLAPAAAQFNLDKIDDKGLVVMAAVIQAIHKKYAPEDDSLSGKPGGEGAGGSGGQGTVEEKRAEMRKLIASKAFSNWQDPEHEATNKRVQQLAREMAELQKA